jgi:hypothetical protein
MKMYRGMDVQIHVFFDLGTRRRRVASFTPQPLYSWGKSPRHPLDRRLDEPQNRLVDMERRKIFPLLRHKL